MKLYRCRWDRKIGGVCGGLGNYFKVDPTIIRLITIVLWIITGIIPVTLIYFILWIAMPEGPRAYIKNPARKLYRSLQDRKLSGICGGLGKYLKIDSTMIRIVLIILAIATAFLPFLIAYIIASFIIPEEPRVHS